MMMPPPPPPRLKKNEHLCSPPLATPVRPPRLFAPICAHASQAMRGRTYPARSRRRAEGPSSLEGSTLLRTCNVWRSQAFVSFWCFSRENNIANCKNNILFFSSKLYMVQKCALPSFPFFSSSCAKSVVATFFVSSFSSSS